MNKCWDEKLVEDMKQQWDASHYMSHALPANPHHHPSPHIAGANLSLLAGTGRTATRSNIAPELTMQVGEAEDPGALVRSCLPVVDSLAHRRSSWLFCPNADTKTSADIRLDFAVFSSLDWSGMFSESVYFVKACFFYTAFGVGIMLFSVMSCSVLFICSPISFYHAKRLESIPSFAPCIWQSFQCSYGDSRKNGETHADGFISSFLLCTSRSVQARKGFRDPTTRTFFPNSPIGKRTAQPLKLHFQNNDRVESNLLNAPDRAICPLFPRSRKSISNRSGPFVVSGADATLVTAREA